MELRGRCGFTGICAGRVGPGHHRRVVRQVYGVARLQVDVQVFYLAVLYAPQLDGVDDIAELVEVLIAACAYVINILSVTDQFQRACKVFRTDRLARRVGYGAQRVPDICRVFGVCVFDCQRHYGRGIECEAGIWVV